MGLRLNTPLRIGSVVFKIMTVMIILSIVSSLIGNKIHIFYSIILGLSGVLWVFNSLIKEDKDEM